MGNPSYTHGFDVTLHPRVLNVPLTWKRPRTIFVNSMSDLFHEEVPTEFIRSVFDVMARAHRHRFQILTKRAERLSDLGHSIEWPPNVWMGVTVERADYLERIDTLRRVPAAVRFLSLEPLLGPLGDLNLDGIDWVIVGGESGPGARAMGADWARDIREQCQAAGVPFFFKQWGGWSRKKAGRELDGRTWSEMPTALSGRAVSASRRHTVSTPLDLRSLTDDEIKIVEEATAR
jgi:protein gp37